MDKFMIENILMQLTVFFPKNMNNLKYSPFRWPYSRSCLFGSIFSLTQPCQTSFNTFPVVLPLFSFNQRANKHKITVLGRQLII